MNLFGRKKNKDKELPSLDDAVQALRQAAELLEKREAHLRREKEKAHEEGVKCMKAKDKQKAIFYLRRIKVYDKQIMQLHGKQMNLDGQLLALQSASVDRGILDAMRTAQSALKTTVSDQEIDRVSDLMDDIEESTQLTSEMSEILSRNIGMDEIDDEELLAAFEEEMEDTMITQPVDKVADIDTTTLPTVPKKKEEVEHDEKVDEELKQLDALML